jgi:hypothetical protein
MLVRNVMLILYRAPPTQASVAGLPIIHLDLSYTSYIFTRKTYYIVILYSREPKFIQWGNKLHVCGYIP